MDKGAVALARMLIIAVVLGLVVILANPVYRRTAASILQGRPAASPIWKSNASYYTDVGPYPQETHEQSE